MSVQTNAKLYALRETIANAIKDGNLEKKMDVIKLQAAELGLEEKTINQLISEQREIVNKQNSIIQIIRKKKTLLWIVCLAVVIIEWIIGLSITLPSKSNEGISNNGIAITVVDEKNALDKSLSSESAITEFTENKDDVNLKNVSDSSNSYFSFMTIIWLLIINVVSLLIIVFCLAYFLNRKYKDSPQSK